MRRKRALYLAALCWLLMQPAVASYNVADYYNVTAHELLYKRAFNAQGTSGNPAWAAGVRGDDQPRIQLTTDGTLRFGAGGTSTVDLMLKRLNSTTLGLRDVADTAYQNLTVGTLTATAVSASSLSVPSITGLTSLSLTDLTSTNVTATNLTVNGTSVVPVTYPLSIANGGTASTAVGSSNTFLGTRDGSTLTYTTVGQSDLPTSAYVVPGGATSVRALPTGCPCTLTGDYVHIGNYTTDGTLTCNHCRITVVGTLQIDHAITVNTELPGGLAGPSTAGAMGGWGAGIGAGSGGVSTSTNVIGGAGGGFGGTGGNGGTGSGDRGARGGVAYDIYHQLFGSSGGGGVANAASANGAGGAGGGGILIQATGTITVNANITAAGATGGATAAASTGAGGGGSGGGVDIRSLSTVTINVGKTISVIGGDGGSAAGGLAAGGGGGAGGYVAIHGSTVTNSGTITLTGGNAGSGSAGTAATAGGNGTSLVESVVWPLRQY